MLKKLFGIMKKRQKFDEAKEEGEIALKNEEGLYKEESIEKEQILTDKKEIENKEVKVLEQEIFLSNEDDKILEKEDIVCSNKSEVPYIKKTNVNNDNKILNKVETVLIDKYINDEYISNGDKKKLIENKKDDSKKVEELDQEESCVLLKSDVEEKQISETSEYLTEEDLEYIKEIKIKRGKSIKAINLYTREENIFDTHIQCSKALRVPLGYIRENLKYGCMDYFGDAINYLSKVLKIEAYCKNEWSYLENSKSPSEIFSILNDKIFSTRLSDKKRNEILTNSKIEALKMNYRFECIDEEYDEYFKKYKSIIKRGGKKKVELVNKKGDVLEIFKSLEECAIYLQKEKNEVIQMLKYGDTKVGRNFIRYSLRSI
ncbi:TPA: hypothetical protein KON86_004396 [Clostridioides difficile]|uniref:hypothetical protein n=1 Tax=Clostridioides difficile TaxID=1496 RepID=UPI001C1AA70E|nr:hypothetical protein [Clostridioides difficile]HBF0841600.1 hypothetical protein [Clostridioides difficile]HBF0845233.1 hypothetical protein [Clostridioides difficile]HBF4440471.1 hypothetical protein [Clostridioides difficile]HBF4444682.1 hypothetical protein [Clostridioides difficile]